MIKPMPKLTRLNSKVATINTDKAATFSVNRITGRELGRIRKRIAVRDMCVCQRCHQPTSEFEIDHRIPLFMGGSDSDENRQLLCIACHKLKSLEDLKLQQGVQ